jgi:6-phosphogluconolactonase (cycloisomerase 2 family)
MTSKLVHAFAVLRTASGAALACLAGCDGGPDLGSGPPPPGYAYITSGSAGGTQSGAVYQYAVGADGSLTPLNTASVPTGLIPTSIVSDPSGRYVYVVNQGDATISQYVVGSGGGLAPLSPTVVNIAAPFPAIGAYAASIDPSGRFLYVVAVPLPLNPPVPSASIAQYSIGAGGTLTSLTPAYVSVPAAAMGPLAIEPSGQYAYLASATSAAGGQVSQFFIGNDGTLAPLTPAVVAVTRTPNGVAIAPSGQTAYVLSSCIDTACEGQVAQYTIATNGTLTATGSTTLTGGHVIPVGMVIDASGSSAYLLTNLMGVDTNIGAVYGYAINSAGDLVPDTPPSVGVASGAVAEAAYGPNLYALSANARGFASNPQPGGHVDHYAIGPGGRLSAAGTTTLAEGFPAGITLVTAH